MFPQKFREVAVLYHNLWHTLQQSNVAMRSKVHTLFYYCLSCSTESWQVIQDINISCGSIGTNTELHAIKHYSVAILPQAQVVPFYTFVVKHL